MAEGKDKSAAGRSPPCALQSFTRQTDVDAWPGSPQFAGGHLAVANRSWRTQWPAIDLAPCNKCNLCLLFCPDAAIVANADGFPQVEADWCKGCGICAVECPKQCIAMGTEETTEEADKDGKHA
jgi:pyruvate ferredoxin oxidoreductase delta subunit